MQEQNRGDKITELVEAILIVGARRGSSEFLSHAEARAKIEPHIKSLSKRFANLDRPQSESDNALEPQFECEYCKDTKRIVIEGTVHDQQGRQHENPILPCPVCWKEEAV
ncbi:MAG: hypothetical protein ACR2LC_09545 [Pyrinomonadaceae bacterium]